MTGIPDQTRIGQSVKTTVGSSDSAVAKEEAVVVANILDSFDEISTVYLFPTFFHSVHSLDAPTL